MTIFPPLYRLPINTGLDRASQLPASSLHSTNPKGYLVLMVNSTRKKTNELEFQGQVLVWLNDEISKRPGLHLDKATQEKPQTGSGHRSDLIVWVDRAKAIAFLAIELKTPVTPINDPHYFVDATLKAQKWQAEYLAVWNLRELEVYKTPALGESLLPSDVIFRPEPHPTITTIEDWLNPAIEKDLRNQAVEFLDAAVLHAANATLSGQTIDTEIFVRRLIDTIGRLRDIFHRDLRRTSNTNRNFRLLLNRLAAAQGFMGFVDDIDYAIAGQISYRFIGQILFYFALRRKIPDLKELRLSPQDKIPEAFRPYWNEVRRYDYEALYQPGDLETLVPVDDAAQTLIRRLIGQLHAYDWASLTDDVLGSIFERLVPHEEQILLGQFYTPRPVADLLVALTVDGEKPLVLDPGCGSGTFLMSVYSYLVHTSGLSHVDLLSTIWGFDISPFAAELAVINLFRQDMSEYDNFPRIVPGSFFDRSPGEIIEFPVPKATREATKTLMPIPLFDCIIGNPPYLRSQNQDDLNSQYRATLLNAAARAGIQPSAKTDLFAFFIYHGLRFMKEGARLGLLTPASWLTADYARSLQEALLGDVRISAIIASNAEAFFPQVDVNTVLLVAKKVREGTRDEPIRFVTLKKPIAELTAGRSDYWSRVIGLVDRIESTTVSNEEEGYRVKLVDPCAERQALAESRKAPRNWSKYLRAPLSYYRIFEGSA